MKEAIKELIQEYHTRIDSIETEKVTGRRRNENKGQINAYIIMIADLTKLKELKP